MTDEEKEKFYDDQIAIPLMEVARKLEEADIPFLAAVFYRPDCSGETRFIPKDCQSAYVRTVEAAISARGNADALIGWMMRHGKKYGHTSACLTILEQK